MAEATEARTKTPILHKLQGQGDHCKSISEQCRICWAEDWDGEDSLVAPCKCTGSMVCHAFMFQRTVSEGSHSVILQLQRYVHLSCLGHWQSQLRRQKGILKSRKCDVCNSAWKKPYNNLGLKPYNNALVSAFQAARPMLCIVWEWWKALVFARSVLAGLESGVHGFNLGMRYRSIALTEAAQPILAFSPFSLFAAVGSPMGSMIPLSAFLILYGAMSTVGILQGFFFGITGAYAGVVSGFSEGLACTILSSMKLIGSVTMAGGSIISTFFGIFFGRRC